MPQTITITADGLAEEAPRRLSPPQPSLREARFGRGDQAVCIF